MAMVIAAATADAATPMNFMRSWRHGVDPSQYPVFKSVMVWPETESAVHTMPAIIMTKNMPVVPERPNWSSTTDDTIMVNMVMPETGLRAVVAMHRAATEVKKNEKNRTNTTPMAATAIDEWSLPSSTATAMVLTI